MKSLVIDCSVTMGWCFTDEHSGYSATVLSALNQAVGMVPVLWTAEVSNVLITAERKKRIVHSDVVEFLALLSSLPISFDSSQPRIHDITNIARNFSLSGYDACYLELAMRLGAPLATNDKALQRAAKLSGATLFKIE